MTCHSMCWSSKALAALNSALRHWTVKLVNTSDASCWLMRVRVQKECGGCDAPCCGLSVTCHGCVSVASMWLQACQPLLKPSFVTDVDGGIYFISHFETLHGLVKAPHVIWLSHCLPCSWIWSFLLKKKITSSFSDWNKFETRHYAFQPAWSSRNCIWSPVYFNSDSGSVAWGVCVNHKVYNLSRRGIRLPLLALQQDQCGT